MFPQSKRVFEKHAAKAFDICMLVVAFALATVSLYASRKTVTLEDFMAMRIRLGTVFLFLFLIALCHSLFVLCSLYESKRLTSHRAELRDLSKATLLASIFLLGMAMTFHIWMVRPMFALLFWAYSTVLMACGRVVARSTLRYLRRNGRNVRYLLIVGTNERALDFARRVTLNPDFGYRIVGFVDEDWSGIRHFDESGQARCSDFAGLAAFLRHNVVDEAAIFLPLRSYYHHSAHLATLGEHGIAVRFDTQVFNLAPSHSSIQQIDTDPEILLASASREVWPAMAKRSLDVVLSGLLLVIVAPLLAVVAALVKWTSPGPMLFVQSRMGLNKRRFRMYKFRTMTADAERVQEQLLDLNEMSGPVFKIKNDPRITPLGKFLRKTSIDELPQLLNVLRGDMSLVGPRAMSLRDYKLFEEDWQRRRFSVKPGITCLWQVNGRNSVPFETWMELDMQYIDRWSLWLDLKILAQTIPAVVRGSGAA